MKRAVALLVIFVMCISLCSCLASEEDTVRGRVSQAAYELWVYQKMRLDGQEIKKSKLVSIDEVVKATDGVYIVSGEIELTDEISRNWTNDFVVNVVWNDDENKWIVEDWEFVYSQWERR